jgi:hypothetical protein
VVVLFASFYGGGVISGAKGMLRLSAAGGTEAVQEQGAPVVRVQEL